MSTVMFGVGALLNTTISTSADASAALNTHGNVTAYRLFGHRRLRQADAYHAGPPVAALVPPGRCAFGPTWSAARLRRRQVLTHDTLLLTFALPDPHSPLGLSTLAHIHVRGHVGPQRRPVIRPYTPVSTNAMLGEFQLLVKVYQERMALSHWLGGLEPGSDAEFRHISRSVKIQYPFGGARRIGMIAGGSGIAPMLQALHAILGTASDSSQVVLIYSSQTASDVIARETLESWASAHASRFRVHLTVTREPPDSAWTGARGRIDRSMLLQRLPPPSENPIVFVCGPPGMYVALSGARGDLRLSGALGELGYDSRRVVKL